MRSVNVVPVGAVAAGLAADAATAVLDDPTRKRAWLTLNAVMTGEPVSSLCDVAPRAPGVSRKAAPGPA
jgi:hypothetical protein